MNDFGNLATKIVNYDFPCDTDEYPVSYVSGWLEANIEELGVLVNEEFAVDATGSITVGDCTGLLPQEEAIFSKMFESHYYSKSARESLRSSTYSSALDWVSIKEGDTSIQRQNKNSVARTYRDLKTDADTELNNLVFQFNRYKSGPRQVYGEDGVLNIDGLHGDQSNTYRS